MANLVIVESPSKASTIKGYLGSNYKVIASVGHVRDLPKSTLGVDVDNNFEPHYINIRGKGDIIKEIKKEAKNAGKVFLATDPDREGETISWHLAGTIGLAPEKVYRITFNEITKSAVKAAVKAPREINMNLVNAQQTRRILDRIVGYKLSPFLWKKVKSGLSAGRVQSVATRIIVERENEIKSFEPEEYWTIDAILSDDEKRTVSARFVGDVNGKIKLKDETDAAKVLTAVEKDFFVVDNVKKSVKHKTPAPPFTTSTMQQEASKKLGFQTQRIMRVAQELYEGVNIGSEFGGVQGLITYMRTDSLRVSAEAQIAAREYIVSKYGDKYCPKTPRIYKSKANVQDAHEAIRPANVAIEPYMIRKNLTLDQYKLYKLIWERFVSSQMESAALDTVTVDFVSSGYIFRTSGYTVTFNGYMALYEESSDEEDGDGEKNMKVPPLTSGQKMDLLEIEDEQHFTEPPARYTEASLIKFLEEKGIGRPSTYAPIITTIVSRNYVKRDGKALVPTTLGEVTTRLMEESFPEIVDYKFTANMEDKLDEIEKGGATMVGVLSEFYEDFAKQLEVAQETIAREEVDMPAEETDIICDKCGAKMIVKVGRYGKFAACPNYPQCKNTKPLVSEKEEKPEKEKEKEPVVADFKCEKCGSDMVLRSGRYGSFYACSRFPECKFTKQKVKELGVACPECGSKVVVKHGRNKTVFYSCERYPECSFSSWDMPTSEKCPECGKMLVRKKGKSTLACIDKNCKYKREIDSDKVNADE